jgi:DNA-binding GntR family transcriptional regulator
MTVVGFDPTASRETIQLRLILESELLRHFVTNATDADVKEHADLAAKFAYTNAAPTSSGTRAANYQLHRHMYELARLPQTLQFVEILWSRCPFYTINEFEGRTDRAAREHSEILLHIAARDVELAVNATCRHIVAGWEALPSS